MVPNDNIDRYWLSFQVNHSEVEQSACNVSRMRLKLYHDEGFPNQNFRTERQFHTAKFLLAGVDQTGGDLPPFSVPGVMRVSFG